MLCLAPIELVTEAERRLHRAVSGLGPGTGVLGGLVVFVPVVDGAMQRRQADAVAFLPETVVVVRALGMGRQAGELRPSASGSWTVGGDILRLSGGGSTPAAQLRKAVELIHAALDSGGLDPGSPSALAAIDGAITSVRDRSAGGPVACSMDAGDVLTGLRHCANVGSQGDTRVWTTADVKAALTIFGLQARGPSVEELNNEGFLYSPYVLRGRQSAVGAGADLAPALSLLSGSFAPPATAQPPASRQARPTPSAAPVWDEPDRMDEPDSGQPVRNSPGRPEPRTPMAAESVVAADVVHEPQQEDGGVGGLFAEAADHDTGTKATGSSRKSGKPRSRRSSRPRLFVGVAVLLVFAVVAALVYTLSSGQRGDDPEGAATEAGGTTPAAGTSATTTSPSAQPTQEIAGSTYTLAAVRSDTDCAVNSYGQVAEFFAATPCSGLARALFTTTVDDAPAVVSVSVVSMPDEATAEALQVLVDTSGTGNVSDLLRAGVEIDGGPGELVAAVYSSELTGTVVRIVEVAWVDADADADADASRLEAAADDALLLEVESG